MFLFKYLAGIFLVLFVVKMDSLEKEKTSQEAQLKRSEVIFHRRLYPTREDKKVGDY